MGLGLCPARLHSGQVRQPGEAVQHRGVAAECLKPISEKNPPEVQANSADRPGQRHNPARMIGIPEVLCIQLYPR